MCGVMARRTLRDTINTSPHVDKLDHAAEVFYRRLMSEVDDYGRFDAMPVILRSKCYPIRVDRVREADVVRWLAACQDADLIRLYEVDEARVSHPIPSEGLLAGAAALTHNSFLVMLRVEPPRAIHSKYPQPPDDVICWRPSGDKRKPPEYRRLRKNENICAQTGADASYSSSYSSTSSICPPGGESIPEEDAASRILRTTGLGVFAASKQRGILEKCIESFGEAETLKEIKLAMGDRKVVKPIDYAATVLTRRAAEKSTVKKRSAVAVREDN